MTWQMFSVLNTGGANPLFYFAKNVEPLSYVFAYVCNCETGTLLFRKREGDRQANLLLVT